MSQKKRESTTEMLGGELSWIELMDDTKDSRQQKDGQFNDEMEQSNGPTTGQEYLRYQLWEFPAGHTNPRLA
jgi:hypothetical protein